MVRFLTPFSPIPAGTFCARVIVPDDYQWRAALFGALQLLVEPQNWEQFGNLTPDATCEELQPAIFDAQQEGDWCMLGSVFPYMTATPPPHTLACDGANYSRADYPNLYSALDPAFIIDDDTFFVPNLSSSFVFGADLTDVGEFPVGSTGGEQDVTLTVDEIPAHSHDDAGHQHYYTAPLPGLAVAPGELPVDVPGMAPITPTSSGNANIQNTGGGQSHTNMPPYTALRWCVVFE